jgi:RNA polymerase sigma factor (TIGR02999 family)
MLEQRRSQVTAALQSYLEAPDPTAADRLMELVYVDLRRLAARLLRGERRGHTLSPTDLVHEAYTRLVDQTRVDWRGKTHFFAIAAQAMRRILIDYARKHARARRGGDLQRVTLDIGAMGVADTGLDPEDLLALDAALDKLAAIDKRGAQVVELRFFVGLSNEEIAEYLSVSTRSVTRDWLYARSWLRRELAIGEDAGSAPPEPRK